MAGESYYILFSLLGVLVLTMHIINLVCVRAKGKTLFGEDVGKGTIGYKKFKAFLSLRGILLAVLFAIIVISNAVYCVYRVIGLEKPDYAQFMLIDFPIGATLLFVLIIAIMRNQFMPRK